MTHRTTSKDKIDEYYVNDSETSSDDSSYSRSSIEGESQEDQLPQIIKWRRAITKDRAAIKQLQTLSGQVANVLYRKRNIDELIEKSCFPIVQLDSRGKLVSFTAYDPYPNIPALPSFFWNEWLSTIYKIRNANSGNVLFVHYMVWQPQQANKFLRLLLETSFTEFIQLKLIIIIKPPKADVPDFYTEYFLPVLPSNLETLSFDSIQTLLVCLRTSIIRPLPIRTAFEEDYDMIVSIISGQPAKSDILNDPSVHKNVGFIFSKEKKTLVCKVQGDLAGIMIVNLKVDVDSLNETFELAPFHGLRKREEREESSYEPQHSTFSRQSIWEVDHPNALISSDYLLRQMKWDLSFNKEKIAGSPPNLGGSDESLSSMSSSTSGFSIFEYLPLFDETKEEIWSVQSNKMSSLNAPYSRNEFPHKMTDVKVSVRTSMSRMSYYHAPKHHGISNAFVIDFFAINCEKIDEKISSFDFLQAAFKIVPDRDYCLLIIPTDVVSFPLMKLFVRVTPRPLSNHKYELYLCHKMSLSSNSMTVRKTKEEDLNAISNFLNSVNNKEQVYQDILDSCDKKKNEFRSYVFTVGSKIAGISLIDLKKVYAEFFQTYFDISCYTVIELHKNENQSVIKYLIINPIFRNHILFFVRDIMRLADLTCLYYVSDEHRKERVNKLAVLDEFVPIRPKQKAGSIEDACILSENEEVLYKIPFSLYFMNTKICGYSKLHINTVVVVVGTSQTAFSFLESLIFGKSGLYVTYNNLFWVTPHELEEEKSPPEAKDFMFPIEDNCSRQYKSMVFLGAYVNFVYGVMTEINRSEKYIIVNNKVTLRYDYLILTCGLQYLSPTPKAKDNHEDGLDKHFRSSLSRFLVRSESKRFNLSKHPVNMFVINTSSDAQTILLFLGCLMRKMKNIHETDKKIVLYGHDLQLFLTLQTLLKMGIPGDFIVFVEPFPSDDKSFTIFNDSYVDQAVIESVKNCKIHYYTEYYLYDWSLTSDDFITTLNFHSNRKQIVIPCLVFLPFLEKLVSDVTFKACNNAGLVYDGRLVINHNFRTNDKYIYGAGPFTKYARRYYADDQNHEFFSSKEVGQKLADIIRYQIDPTFEDKNKYKEESDLVPQMKAPLLCYCQLPGDFNYFFVKKPGKTLDLETAYNNYDYGEVLTTGRSKMEDGTGYFRIHLNSNGFVEDITCYTKNKIDYVSLSCLYGLHERLLNNLVLRFDLSLIPDFYEYFSQPWAVALFHNNFQVLREFNYRAFDKKSEEVSDGSFIEKLMNRLVQYKWRPLPDFVRDELESEYEKSSVKIKITKNLLEFLEHFRNDFPSYAIPSFLKY